MTTEPAGLRERKKRATRQALREAALRLALERGPDNVRVDDIAEAAGVSPRTYNNYFASREQAIVAAVTAERESRIAAAVAARHVSIGLADAVVDAIVEQYTDSGEHARDALLLITTRPALRDAFVDTAAAMKHPLTDAIAGRLGDTDDYTAQVLAASVAAAVHVGLERWVRPAGTSPTTRGLVLPSGSLPELLRSALVPLRPALDAAEKRRQQTPEEMPRI
ncbi:MAG TPA: TetR/AcrR family transcriptional regulator [Pseudonocardiaceae bacterium]